MQFNPSFSLVNMIRGLLIVGFLFGGEVLGEEPACYTTNRFEYEKNVLEKLIYLEQSNAAATERIAALERQLQGQTTQSPQNMRSSSTYVHWGMKTCPNVTATSVIFSGQVGGGHFTHTGAGEYVCLPNDPSYDQYSDAADNDRSWMYGTEYETGTCPVLTNLLDFEVPCAVCLARRKTTLMIAGRTSCYSGWTMEYQGYLMGSYYKYNNKGYICLNKHAESFDSSSGNENGAVIYMTEGRCGSLKCPPYKNGAELACVVCSTTS